MKRLLYGTTALVTGTALMGSPALAEEGIKLGLGGYMSNYFGVLVIERWNMSGVWRKKPGPMSV